MDVCIYILYTHFMLFCISQLWSSPVYGFLRGWCQQWIHQALFCWWHLSVCVCVTELCYVLAEWVMLQSQSVTSPTATAHSLCSCILYIHIHVQSTKMYTENTYNVEDICVHFLSLSLSLRVCVWNPPLTSECGHHCLYIFLRLFVEGQNICFCLDLCDRYCPLCIWPVAQVKSWGASVETDSSPNVF